MTDAKHFFSEPEKLQIAKTISEVEKSTAGEIRLLVEDRSDAYPEATLLGGMLIGGIVALAITDRFFHDSLWAYIPCAFVCFLLAGALLKLLPDLRRLFVFAHRAERRVREHGALLFYAHGLHKTREGTGVLFLLSLFERKVWILADAGIYQKLRQEELQTYTSKIVAGIGKGNKTEAICAEIRRLGETLARHFPPRLDDTDELANEVIVEGKQPD